MYATSPVMIEIIFFAFINSDLSVFSFQVQNYKENHEEREIIRLIYVFLNYMATKNPVYNPL